MGHFSLLYTVQFSLAQCLSSSIGYRLTIEHAFPDRVSAASRSYFNFFIHFPNPYFSFFHSFSLPFPYFSLLSHRSLASSFYHTAKPGGVLADLACLAALRWAGIGGARPYLAGYGAYCISKLGGRTPGCASKIKTSNQNLILQKVRLTKAKFRRVQILVKMEEWPAALKCSLDLLRNHQDCSIQSFSYYYQCLIK